ncbi:CRISPR-associated helicase Cas3' [Arsenicicoccus dermatophilus]|nr:CRISPR-associated helicase Cas3' [Arsenicicoccus dermatophilus]MCH8611573.1 CRISPR-associated helicase Cas3' [Arsenicicoccus dermatophilus]
MGAGHPALWAKRPERLLSGEAPYPVSAHLLDTTVIAGVVWDTVLTGRVRRLLARELEGGTSPHEQATARAWVTLAAGAHDLFKISAGFQLRPWRRDPTVPWRQDLSAALMADGYSPMSVDAAAAAETREDLRRHDFLGMCLLSARDRGIPAMSAETSWLALAVGGHHGAWLESPPAATATVLADATAGRWGEAQTEHLELVAQVCGVHPSESPRVGPELAGVVTMLITGIVQLSDWLASEAAVVDAGLALIEQGLDPMSPTWAQTRAAELATHVTTSLGSYSAPTDRHRTAVGLDGDGRVRSLRPLQEDAEQVGDGLWFVAYPTSEGKTGAALLRHQVEQDEGLIFALPTRATTDAMQRRLQRAFSGTGNGVLLSHQFASLYRCPATEGHGFEWFSTSTRRLLAPVVAATCDQVLAGSLPQRHLPLRLLALTNHHVVLDEVHTYDRYQTTLLAALMAWWGRTGTRVTVLSATMPTWQRRALEDAYTGREASGEQATAYPAHWLAGHDAPSSPALQTAVPDLRLPITHTDDATQLHREWVVATYDRYPRCSLAVVRSRVDDAVATARLLGADLAGRDVDVLVLHSRMTLAHRAEIERELEARLGPGTPRGRRPLVVCATQVLDVSLDVSFWSMACDIAPAASLVQRAGRLWRFLPGMQRLLDESDARPAERALHVVVPDGAGPLTEQVALPYFADELAAVARSLEEHPTLRIPEDVQDFVDRTTYDLARSSLADLRLAELVDASMRQEAAGTLAAGVLGLVDPFVPATHATLAAATSPPPSMDGVGDLELTTRYSTLPSATFVLVGGTRGTPASPAELAAMTDDDRVREALGSLFTVSGASWVDRVCAVATATSPDWKSSHPLLTHARPVSAEALAEAGLVYDDVLGLTTLTDEETS